MADPLFSSEQVTPTPATQENTPPASQDNLADLLKGIVNDQGQQKYSSIPEALKGLDNAQKFIQQLLSEKAAVEAEAASVKAELEQRASLEDVISKISTPKTESLPTPSAIGSDDIEKLVANAIEKKQQQTMAESNLQNVQEQLLAKFGDKTQQVIREKAKELGLTPEQIGQMAQQSPKAALTLFSVSQTKAPNLSTPSVNSTFTAKLPDGAPQPPTWEGKSLLAGATKSDLAEAMRRVKEYVYKQNGVEV